MLQIAKKEVISVVQFIIAIICYENFKLVGTMQRYPEDRAAFDYRCALLSTTVFFLIVAPSTWLYNSVFPMTRVSLLAFSAVVQWCYVWLIITTFKTFYDQYQGDYIFKHFESLILGDDDLEMIAKSRALEITAVVLLILLTLVMTALSILKLVLFTQKKYGQEQVSTQSKPKPHVAAAPLKRSSIKVVAAKDLPSSSKQK